MQKALDTTGDAAYATYTYTQADGKALSYIIGGEAERVGAQSVSPKRRETCSRVFHVYQGTGYTEVDDGNGDKKVLKWTTSDTFAVPSWYSVIHHNDSNEAAYLFSYNDKPLLENLGLYRSE